MNSLRTRDASVVWHPYTQMLLEPEAIPVVRGEGALLYDPAGGAYIDAISSWWVNLHGHCHPHIVEALTAQVRALEHVIFAGFTHEPAVRLAKIDTEAQPAKAPAKEEPKPQLKLEDVRAVLAEKSRAGHTAEVRTLLQKYGAEKLSAVDPANYEALMKDAEVIGNGS